MILNKFTTPYSAGCLAISDNRLWTDSDIESRHLIEQTHDGKIIRWIKKPNPKGTVLTGLRYVAWNKGPALIYNFGTFYEGDPFEHSVGVLFLNDLSHKILEFDNPAALRRGGTMWTPYGMGIGFGGYYERAEDMGISWGPSLSVMLPDGTLKELLGYPTERCIRPEYKVSVDVWLGDGKTWSAADLIGGSIAAGGAVWLPGGPVFFARLGTGEVYYREGLLRAEGYADYMFSYQDNGETFEGPVIKEHAYGDVRGVALHKGKLYGFCSGEKPEIKEILMRETN